MEFLFYPQIKDCAKNPYFSFLNAYYSRADGSLFGIEMVTLKQTSEWEVQMIPNEAES